MTRPDRDELSMEIAKVVARRSTCERASVGVVISLDGRVLATGYNGAPRGMSHCNHKCNCSMLIGPTARTTVGKHHQDRCSFYTDNHCTNIVHAEANAIAFAARHGIRLDGADLFTTLAPCDPCAKLIVNAGIVRVQCGVEYQGFDGIRVMEQAGIEVMYPAAL